MAKDCELRYDGVEREDQIARRDRVDIVKALTSVAAEETRTTVNKNPRLGSFLSNLGGYFSACREVQSLDGWMRLNKQRFGSGILYVDEVAGGLVVGYAAGIVAKTALKMGLLLVGAGYVAVQTMSYYGLLSVNWRKVDETIRSPLDAVGNADLSDENAKAIKVKIKQFFGRSMPCTTGFATGLAWGILKG